jgi:alpha-N-arabinofuranosidase
MKKTNRIGFLIVILLLNLSFSGIAQNKIIIRADQPGAKIDKAIYGHFAEHLGHCIYGGIYVGDKSDIPTIRGFRTDVVCALKDLKVP